MNQIWKDLKVTDEEKKLAEEIRMGGAGRSLSEEELTRYSVAKEWDMQIDTTVGETLVHMYCPVETDELLPLYINIHGGGFVKGRRDQDIVYCRNISSRSGCIVADIDYVPSPDMRYPGQVYACYDVVQYFAAHAEESVANRERIAVGGHSAGGNLTAALILMAIDRGGFVPTLQILDYAGLDMCTPTLERRNGDSNPSIPPWKSDFYNKMYVDPEDAGEVYCSPAFASDEQMRKMPQTLMIYCDNDMFCDEAEVYAGRLLRLGVPVYAKRFFHSNHGFVVRRNGEYEVAEKMILRALRCLTE